MKKIKLLITATSVLVIVVLFSSIYVPSKAAAATDSISSTTSWDGSCGSGITVSGATSANYYYTSGDTINLTVNNSSSSPLEIGVKGQSPVAVSGNSSQSVSMSLGSESAVDIYSSSCSGNDYFLYVYGESGSASCSLQGKVWNVSVSYSGLQPSSTISVYRGGTYVDNLSTGSGSVSVNLQFAGQSTAQTYYVYNGPSSAGSTIGQAACPAIAVASSSSSSSKPSVQASSASSTPTAPSTPSKTASVTTTSSKTSTPKPTSNTTSTSQKTISTNYTASKYPIWIPGLSVVVAILVGLLGIVSCWIVFKKANRPGWAAIIPVYNIWVLLEIGGYQGWWALLIIVPILDIVTIVFLLLSSIRIAERFGKSKMFGVVGLFLFGIVGYTILAFSDAKFIPKQ